MIKIYCKNIQLPVVSETLTVATKNSVFSDSFSLDYSKHPFLIIENQQTATALGSRHIMSLQKKSSYDVTVIKQNKVYFGKLKVKSYLLGARKCDLVFGSDLIKILDKKLPEFMPLVFLDDNNQIDYNEETTVKYSQDNILQTLQNHEKKVFPQVDFQFPEIKAPDFVDMESPDFVDYKQFINLRESGKLIENYTQYNEDTYEHEVYNYSLFLPMVYLFSVFKHALNTIGYQLAGDFFTHQTFKNCLILYKNTSNTKFYPTYQSEKFTLTSSSFSYFKKAYISFIEFPYNQTMDYVFKIKLTGIKKPIGEVKLNNLQLSLSLSVNTNNDSFLKLYKYDSFELLNNNMSLEDEFVQKVNASNNLRLNIVLYHKDDELPSNIIIEIKPVFDKKALHLIHPTVNLANHVPDWSFSKFINTNKNFFNLKIEVDDVSKTFNVNFSENYLSSKDFVDLSEYKLELTDYESNAFSKFIISNVKDQKVVFDDENTSDVIPINDKIEVNNDFFTLPFESGHHELLKDDLEGGLILILNQPGTSLSKKSINNQTLELDGDAGVVKNYWQNWVRFRQNSSKIILKGKITRLDIIRIVEKQKVYYQNVVYLVDKVIVKEHSEYVETELHLYSKMF